MAETEDTLSSVQIRTLTGYSAELKKKYSEYEANFLHVIELCGDEEDLEETLSTDQDEINQLFIETNSLIDDLITSKDFIVLNSLNQSQVSVSKLNSQGSTASHVKLPKLELKHFDGNHVQWVSFINLFNTAIHSNENISDVTKFQYLLSVLSNEPLNLIKSLNITSPNYKVAYDILHDRYHNTRRLITLHLNHILDLPNISASYIKPLREFVNMFYEHTQALKALECDISLESNPLLSALILRKMDNDLRLKLEVYRSNKNANNSTSHTLPLIQNIIEFLNSECSQVEDANLHNLYWSQSKSTANSSNQYQKHSTFPSKKVNHSPKNVAMISTQCLEPNSKGSKGFGTAHTFKPCFVCQETNHKIYTCPIFKKKTPHERHQIVKANTRCVSCLGNHTSKDCQSQTACFICHQKHHTLLHFDNKQVTLPAETPEKVNFSSNEPHVSYLSSQDKENQSENQSTVLLGTTLIKLSAPNGNSCVLRALLDSASMCNFISEEAAQLLGTRRLKSDLVITGISQNSTHTKGMLNLSLETLSGNILAYEESFQILNKISLDLPRVEISSEVLQKVKHYTLADPSFSRPGKIDVLLGCGIFPHILNQMTHSLGPKMPYVLGTHFGFVVMGHAPCSPMTKPYNNSFATALLSVNDFDLHSSLQKFWQLEEPPVISKKSEEEIVCDKHFQTTHSRDPTGRYTVRLPFKDSPVKLGNSFQNAKRIFFSSEKRLSINPHLKRKYTDFMDDYRNSGHMKLCEDVPNESNPHYYLPHHGVFKGEKIRVVFNASSPTSTNISLNQLLHQGPKLQNDIVNIIFNFRKHPFVFTCDIRQMFRQIVIHPDDQKFQLILWRNNPDEPLQTYQLTTVTYGMTSSPFLAIRTIQKLIEDEGDNHPLATKAIKDQIYVDDILLGSDTLKEALELQKDVISLLASGGFALRKWSSNHEFLLHTVPEDHRESPLSLSPKDQPLFNILGLKWIPNSDQFSYLVHPPKGELTKRTILSSIARIYDPCGWISPIVFWAKSLIQRLWILKIGWDELLPENIKHEWNTFVQELPAIEKIRIPRSLSVVTSSAVHILGFSDASETGFCACVYLRTEDSNSKPTTKLLLAKTKVAPLKKVSLPRLELCAAHLLSNVVHHCITLLSPHLKITNVTLWSDSTITLSWIQTPPFRLKTYIANRVSQIQELTQPTSWRHIRSHDNPADCASRGIFPCTLLEHPLWWNGPVWIQHSPDLWPTSDFTIISAEKLPETKSTEIVTLINSTEQDNPLLVFLLRFSSWSKIVRVLSYMLRFITNTTKKTRINLPLTSKELQTATLKLFKLIQRESFSEEITLLKENKPCSTKIQRLSPFLDKDEIIRVGGRLKHSTLSYNNKHPIVLPKSHSLVNIYVDYHHIKYLHAPPQLLQSLITQEVWILSARSLIRSRIFQCIKCFRSKPRNESPLMGDLPKWRITPSRAFLITGMDFCGPFQAKAHTLRSLRQFKLYVCIFICFATKAVHIETVSDLSASTFIAALSRFVSRRGLCRTLYCDNGTNFLGGNSLLKDAVLTPFFNSTHNRQQISDFCTQHYIEFNFIPPSAPHQGGLWEAAVKSMKYHLRRVIGENVLTIEEYNTITTKIEAIMNSRPLVPLSSDPSDITALTPGHFLIGAPLTALPELNLEDIPLTRLKRWQRIQSFSQQIWKRWSREYLHNLQQRVKWSKQSSNLKVGDLVLVEDSQTSPLSWPLARIIKVHPGSDKIVRVVTLKTKNGTFTRPTVKIFPLPIIDTADSSVL